MLDTNIFCTKMQNSTRSYLLTSGQFPTPSTTENNSSLSQRRTDDTMHFAGDTMSIPMSPYIEDRIHQSDMDSFQGISNYGTETRNVQRHCDPAHIAGISATEQGHVPSSTGLIKNAEDETDALPSELPPSYNELFSPKPKTAEAGTSMDTKTITITRTITLSNNRTNTKRHERPTVNHAADHHQLLGENKFTCICVKLLVIGALFIAVYYITTSWRLADLVAKAFA